MGFLHDGVVLLDYLTLQGNLPALEGARREFCQLWGLGEGCSGARYFCEFGLRWPSGVCIYWGHYGDRSRGEVVDSGRCYLVLSGAACGEYTFQEFKEFLVWAYDIGFYRATRADPALDVRRRPASAQAVDVVGQVRGAFGRGELARLRAGKDLREWSSSGVLSGDGFYCGNRESGSMLRVYDKGLESGSSPAGQWHRWEREFHGLKADFVFKRLVHAARCELGQDVAASDQDLWRTLEAEHELGGLSAASSCEDVLRAALISEVDFVQRRVGDASVKRASRVRWFAEFVGDVVALALPRSGRVLKSLDTWVRGFKRSYGAALAAMIVLAGGDVCRVLERAGALPASSARLSDVGVVARSSSPAVHQYALELEGAPAG